MKPAGEMMINCIISKPGQGGGLGGWEQRESKANSNDTNNVIIINQILYAFNLPSTHNQPTGNSLLLLVSHFHSTTNKRKQPLIKYVFTT